MDFIKNIIGKALLCVLFLACYGLSAHGQEERDLDMLVRAIATIESRGNERAVSGDCVGYLQIRPVLVRECNNILRQRGDSVRYSLSDRLSKEKSIGMFYVIQDRFNPSHDIEKALWIWNRGVNSKVKPVRYIERVMRVYEKLKGETENVQ